MKQVKYLDDGKRRNMVELYAIRETAGTIIQHLGELEDKEEIYLFLVDLYDEANNQIDILWKEEEILANYESLLPPEDDEEDWDYEERYEE